MYSDPFRPGHHWMEPPLVGERPLETPFFLKWLNSMVYGGFMVVCGR